MIRILQSVSNMDRAGIETMLMNYYRSVDKEKIQFDFLCNKKKIGAYDDEIKRLGGKVYYSPGFNPLKIFKYIKFLKKIKHENQNLEIIHAHNGALSSYTLFCAKIAGFKIRIAHSHSTRIPFSKKIKQFDLKWIYKNLLKKFVVCESTYNIACGKEAGQFLFKNAKFDVINNAIFIDNFKYNKVFREKIRMQYGILEDEILIGHVGRFNTVKNHDFIINMFKKLDNESKIKYKLILIGDGELKEKIVNEVLKNGLSKKVIFVDSCSNVNEYYSSMDIFVLPSKFEGIPVVGIEAQTSGLKCIFSNKISDEVRILDNVSFNSIDTTSSVEEWVNEIKKYRKFDREKDIFKISKNYDIKNNAKKLTDIYLNLLKNK